MTGADGYFRQRNAELAAQVTKISDEEGYALLIASVDAKDLHLNLPPDWPHWANMAYVSVSDAACLSLGISPEARLPQINLSDVRERARAINADATRVHLGIAALESAQRSIQQREAQAMSAIGAGRLSVRGASGIDQSDFSAQSHARIAQVPRDATVRHGRGWKGSSGVWSTVRGHRIGCRHRGGGPGTSSGQVIHEQ